MGLLRSAALKGGHGFFSAVLVGLENRWNVPAVFKKKWSNMFFSKHLQIRGQDPLGYGIYLIWWKPLLAISCGLPRPTHLGNPGSEFHPELSWLHPAMAAAKFLVSSADTPGVKHLFQPLVLHIGVTRLSSAGCPNSKLTSCLFDWTGFPN